MFDKKISPPTVRNYSALRVFEQLPQSFLDMLKDLNYNSTKNYIIRKISNIAIRTTYYIFCRRIKIGTILVCCYVNFLSFFLFVVVVAVVVVVCIQVATCRLRYKARPQLYFNALSKFSLSQAHTADFYRCDIRFLSLV